MPHSVNESAPWRVLSIHRTESAVNDRPLRAARILLLIAFSAVPASDGLGQATDAAVSTTPHFALHSDLPTNLNDALITAGRARNAGEPELFHAGAESACFDELAPSLRAGWDLAVDYYAEIVSPAGWSDRQQFLLRLDLVGDEGQLDDDRARQFVELAAAFRAAARPAYSACRWQEQDAGVPVPDDLWHVVLFYTTGETVRRVLEPAGEPGYAPMLYEIFGRSAWSRYREPLESAWLPYVDCDRSLPQAASELMRAIADAPADRAGGRDARK